MVSEAYSCGICILFAILFPSLTVLVFAAGRYYDLPAKLIKIVEVMREFATYMLTSHETVKESRPIAGGLSLRIIRME